MKISSIRVRKIHYYFQKILIKRTLKIQPPKSFPSVKTNILAVCCYMADRPNLVPELVKSVKEAKSTKIDLVVTNNTEAVPSEEVSPYIRYHMPGTQKYVAVARIIEDQLKLQHDYVMIIDDDVRLPKNFFDNYFRIVRGLDLVLSQPAYNKNSYSVGLTCNQQIDGAIAHLTSFIETGPITCFERRIVHNVPFTGGSPMGWGLDYVWAHICRINRWLMGVVDLAPIEHNIRPVAANYDGQQSYLLSEQYLSKVPHVPLCAPFLRGQVIFLKDYPNLSLL